MANLAHAVDMPVPTSPLAHRAPLDGDVMLRELPWCGKLNLRGDPGDASFTRAAADALGVALPANTVAVTDRVTVFWLGPDEWLIHCKLSNAESLAQQLRARLAGLHCAVTEVTDYYALLELCGDKSTEVLARGCPLDLHERAFAAGACAQSRFGNASVLLYRPAGRLDGDGDGDAGDANSSADSTVFWIQVRWSFAGYVWDYLAAVIDSLA